MKEFLPLLAVFFAVVSLDLLDQNKSAGAVFFAVATAVSVVVIFLKQKSKIKK